MAKWTAFPHSTVEHDAASVKKQWARLHTGDAEPLFLVAPSPPLFPTTACSPP